MFMIDMEEGKIVGDDELKKKISSEERYGDWLNQALVESNQIDDCNLKYSDDFSSIVIVRRHTVIHLKILGS